MPPVPRYPDFIRLMEDFVIPLKASLPAGAIRLDGLVGVETPHWVMAEFDYDGATWKVAGDTRFEPLEIAYRDAKHSPAAKPFKIGQTKTQRKLELRDDLRSLQGGRASYLYAYAPRLAGENPPAASSPHREAPGPRIPSGSFAPKEHSPRQPAPAGTDLDRVLAHMSVLGSADGWDEPVTYTAIPLAIMDAVWSIGVKYEGVVNVIARYRKLRAVHGAVADDDTTSMFIEVVSGLGGPAALADALENRQRTSSRSGILKSDAVLREAKIMQAAGVETPDDLRSMSEAKLDALRARWTSKVPGQSSGISWDYFTMLCELPGVKADRMVIRFVADALGVADADVPVDRANALVTRAAAAVEHDPRFLDYAIWLYQRNAQ